MSKIHSICKEFINLFKTQKHIVKRFKRLEANVNSVTTTALRNETFWYGTEDWPGLTEVFMLCGCEKNEAAVRLYRACRFYSGVA